MSKYKEVYFMTLIKRSGTQDKTERPYEIAHRELARKAAAEGFVLLKNEDQILPLKANSEVALFGAGAVKMIKGGTGSGNVYARNVIHILEGLETAGFQITNRSWLEDYEKEYNRTREEWKRRVWAKADAASDNAGQNDALLFAYLATPYEIPAGSIPKEGKGETAIFVLARSAGEGADRRLEKGDYYLSDQEYELVRAVCSLYKNVILIINAGGAVDMSFTDEFPNIKSILYIVQPGQEGGNAVADVLSGKVTPSGRLTATWPLRYEDIPFAREFSGLNGDPDNDFYKQGIYVGYRYFDSFALPVRFGFGSGLSYTTFEQKVTDIRLNGETITVSVNVKNTGDTYSGKDVVQIYVSCPQETLAKEYRKLVGFGKTESLTPCQETPVDISFSIRDLASFDEERSAWILEEGDYGIFAGGSLAEAAFTGSIHLDKEVTTEKSRHICGRQRDLQELTADKEIIRRLRSEWTGLTGSFPSVSLNADVIKTKENIYGRYDSFEEDADLAVIRKLLSEQLISLSTGAFAKDSDSGMIGSAGWSVPGSAAQTSDCAAKEGILPAVLADGPAGVRLTQEYQVVNGKPLSPTMEETIEGGILLQGVKPRGEETWYQFCTAFPVGTLLAQTWNTEIMRMFGQAIGEEMREFHIRFWLAPGMNIQKNPLCGRNFEYYSEDPLIAGVTAASVTKGVQSCPGCGATIKHYACNNQENNRMSVDAVISERALREIYTKGFGIAVKKSQPMAIMTSYNLINGIHAANNYDLCTKLARDEWDFSGLIMTDWTTTNQGPDCTASGCIRAGNDLIMPGKQTDHDDLERALDNGELSLEELQRSAWRLLKALKK